MSTFLMAVVLSTGCCNCGNPAESAGFVNDVKIFRTGSVLKCHAAADTDVSQDWAGASARLDRVLVAFDGAADAAREKAAKTVQSRNRHVAVGLRSVARAANSTFVRPRLSLIVAFQPVVFHVVQSVFARPSAASGVMWDDRDLLDEVSRIA
jgi:hypothetical protein